VGHANLGNDNLSFAYDASVPSSSAAHSESQTGYAGLARGLAVGSWRRHGALPDSGPAGKEPRAHEDEQSDQPRGQKIAHPHPEPRCGPHRLQTGHGRVGRQVIGARIPCVPRQSD
jgi:hypothetical protein